MSQKKRRGSRGVYLSDEEARALIGRKGDLPVGRNRDGGYDLLVKVVVKDVRTGFGRVDLLVEPLYGQGEKWVSREALTLDAPAAPE